MNNVKTFASVPLIIERGADWFAGIGTRGSTGTALFALAGKVAQTGLVEVPMGTTLRQVVFDVGGGMPSKKAFKGVQIGGPSGGCLPASVLDTPIDFDSLTERRLDDGLRRHDRAGRGQLHGGYRPLLHGFHPEGVLRQVHPVPAGDQADAGHPDRHHHRQGNAEGLELLADLAQDVKTGSLCGLGKSAPNPVLTTLRYFRDEYEAHIIEKRCPALVCKELIAYYILPDKCYKGCDHCVLSCPVDAISTDEKRGIKVIDQAKCTKCGSCILVCPPEYDAIVKLSPPDLVPRDK